MRNFTKLELTAMEIVAELHHRIDKADYLRVDNDLVCRLERALRASGLASDLDERIELERDYRKHCREERKKVRALEHRLQKQAAALGEMRAALEQKNASQQPQRPSLREMCEASPVWRERNGMAALAS